MLRNVFLVLTIGLFAVSAFAKDNSTPEDINKRMIATAKANVKSISAATLKSWIKEEKDFLLLDVREPNEVEAARIETRTHAEMPRGVVEFLLPQRLKITETVVVVYCLVGSRSAIVADVLAKYGYKNVYNLDKGIMGWIKEGYPVANFFGSFEIRNLDSIWLNLISEH
jgi:rhodanese-related sulfurtransferase